MSLTHKEIIEIIETCKGHVKSLKIKSGSVEIEFIESHKPVSESPSTQNLGIVSPESDEQAPSGIQDIKYPKSSEQEAEEMLIDELTISDPSKMEDLIAMKEVKREDQED